jgi:hypothetical protein
VYLENNPGSPVKRVFITGYKPERFLFRITPREGMIDKLVPAIAACAAEMPNPPNVEVLDDGRIDIMCTREAVLGATPIPPDAAAQRLLAFAQPLLTALVI